jgi:hypothetical protein
MKVREWTDILRDVAELDADPGAWRGVGGSRDGGIGEDLYLGHPEAGVYQVKTYAKNPYEVDGVGTRVARRIDDDLDPLFPASEAGGFGVQPMPDDEEEAKTLSKRLGTVMETHAEAPTTPAALFEDVMDAVDSPAYGPMTYDLTDRPEPLSGLADTFEEAESVLEAEFEDVISEDVERGFY